MTDISEILNSEAHDAPAVARRAMEIIRRLESDVAEARDVARRFRVWFHRRGEFTPIQDAEPPWLLEEQKETP